MFLTGEDLVKESDNGNKPLVKFTQGVEEFPFVGFEPEMMARLVDYQVEGRESDIAELIFSIAGLGAYDKQFETLRPFPGAPKGSYWSETSFYPKDGEIRVKVDLSKDPCSCKLIKDRRLELRSTWARLKRLGQTDKQYQEWLEEQVIVDTKWDNGMTVVDDGLQPFVVKVPLSCVATYLVMASSEYQAEAKVEMGGGFRMGVQLGRMDPNRVNWSTHRYKGKSR